MGSGTPSFILELSNGIVILVFNMVLLSISGDTAVAAYGKMCIRDRGWTIISAQDSNNSLQILVGILAVGIVGFVLAIIMRTLEARVCSWSERGK